MSATTHNSTALYELQEQPGASFTTTRGGFDTGRRTFKCWQSVAPTLEPLRGTADSTYQGMRVDSVTTVFDKAGIATIEVNYLGLKNETQLKEDEYSYTVNNDTPPFFVDSATEDTTFNSEVAFPSPSVTHTYITRTLPPNNVGQFKLPPKYADQVPPDNIDFAGLGVNWTFDFLIRDWKLVGRTIKSVGDLHEVSDTYQWVFQISGVTES